MDICIICDKKFPMHFLENVPTLCPGFRSDPITQTKSTAILCNMSLEGLEKELELVRKDATDFQKYCDNLESEKDRLADILQKKIDLLSNTIVEYMRANQKCYMESA